MKVAAQCIRVVVQQPVDAVAKNYAHRLGKDPAFSVVITDSFRTFRRHLRTAGVAMINTTKFDDPKYSFRLLSSLIAARLYGVPVINIFTTDIYDLCDRGIFKPLLFIINFLITRLSARVLVLQSRAHIAKRYGIPEKKVGYIQNYVDIAAWDIPPHELKEAWGEELPEVRIFYHGELLWWHGLERAEAIMEELSKRCRPRLTVAGNLYPSVLNVMGLKLSRREEAIKQHLKRFLAHDYVDWKGKVTPDVLKTLMQESHFHLTQLTADSVVSETEIRTCLLEALAAGMPCIHVRTPALDQFPFEDLVNIIYVEPESPKEAADKVWAVFTNPEKYKSLSLNARKLATELFNLERWYCDEGRSLVQSLVKVTQQ